MQDQDKTKQQLLEELAVLRQRVAELEASERRYRTIIDTLPLAIGEIDRDGIVTFAGAATEQLFGYAPEELVGKAAWEQMEAGAPREAFQAWFRQTMSEQPPPSPVFGSRLKKNGERIDIRGDWNYLRSENGEVTGHVTVVADITESKRAEEALRESERRLSTLISNLPGIAYRCKIDADWSMELVSEGCFPLTGYHRQEVLENRVTSYGNLIHPDDRQMVWDGVQEALAKGQHFQLEYRIRTLTGEEKWVWEQGVGIYSDNGQAEALEGFITDITERKRAEKQLTTTKAVLEATIASLPFDFFAIGPDGRYMMQNATSKAHWGDAAGKPPHEVCVNEDDLSLWLDNNRRAFAGEKVAGDVQLTVAGEKRFYHNVIAPIRAGEQILGILETNVDITERKRAEQALRESETRFCTLFRDSAVGMAVRRPDGGFFQVNRAFCEFFGYSEQELLGKTPQFLTHPEDWEASSKAIQQALEVGPCTVRFEKRYRHKNGQVLWGEVNFSLVCDATGKPEYFITQVLDINERKRAEETLQKAHDELERRVAERTAALTKANEELAIFRKFAEASGEGFGMGDLDAHIAYVNPALCRLFGEEKPEDLIGKSFLTYYPEDWQQRRKNEMIPTQEKEGHWVGELAILSRQGKLIPTLHDVFLLRDEEVNPVCRCVVVTDITERKRAEEALRKSEERFRSYFEQGLIGMGVTSPDRRWQEVNDRLCEILGYSREELIGMTWMDVTYPDDLEPNLVLSKRLLAGEIDHFTMDKRFIRKDGRLVYASIFVRGFRRKDGPLDHMLALTEDITERQQAEEALQREHRTLKHMLQSSDHERQLIAYEIHDGLAQQLAGALMQFQTFDHLKGKQPGMAAKAYDAGMTMLQQSHFEARRLISGVRPPVLDESGVVEAIAHLVHEESRHKGPKIESHCIVDFDRLVPILENAIYRIVQESLTNACNHSQSKRVRISLLQRNNTVRIKIRDWGVGFDPKGVQKNRFGLAGIRERARLLGGKCSIRSKPGTGTSIVVELPVVAREEEE